MNPIVFAHLFLFGVFRPIRLVASRQRAVWPISARPAYYHRLIVSGLFTGFVSLLTLSAMKSGYGFALFDRMFFVNTGWPTWASVMAGVAIVLASSAVDVRLTRRRLLSGHAHTLLQTPESAQERKLWVLASLVSGLGEELTWRCVQPLAILMVTGSAPLAVFGSALTFGVGHVHSGWAWVGATTALALVWQSVVFLLPGGLYVAMCVHVAHNMIVGLATRGAVRNTAWVNTRLP